MTFDRNMIIFMSNCVSKPPQKWQASTSTSRKNKITKYLCSRKAALHECIISYEFQMLTATVFIAELLCSCRREKKKRNGELKSTSSWVRMSIEYLWLHWVNENFMPNLSSWGLIDALGFRDRQLHLDNKPPLGTIRKSIYSITSH